MEFKSLIDLAKVVANAKPNSQIAYSYDNKENFSYSDLNETLRTELNKYASTFREYEKNKNLIFELIETVVSDVLPKRVLEQYGSFADVKTFNQGEKPVFKQKVTSSSKRRAKQFVTKVGLAGIYEVFKLDGKVVEVKTEAFGGAAQIGFEEFLDGRVDFADILDVVMEGLDEAVYKEIAKALKASIANLPQANSYSDNKFVEGKMDGLIAVAESYGTATIYCTREFAVKMLPNSSWISDNMRDEMNRAGYLANYKGVKVIILPQSFEDDLNSKKVIDPSYAWIIPTGADKPVKIAFEGATLAKETESNADWSREIQVYKKLGVATLITNNICVYRDTSLTQ